MVRKLALIAIPLAALAVAAAAGCNSSTPPAGDRPPATMNSPTLAAGTGDPHGHKPGKHGGIIVEIGRDNYHAEAIFEKTGAVRLITLGADEARIEEVESQTLVAYARPAAGSADATEMTFKPAPQPGDAAGKTSQFIGQLPDGLRGKAVEITVPNIRIGGARYRFAFTSAKGDDHAAAEMPAKVADDEERALYLTPGGKYTADDIKANGGVTASQKFKGVKPLHDADPKPGDKLCPISMTKASPKFTWIIDGKPYEFCCPPCVDEFVSLAKDPKTAGSLKDPTEYVQKAKP